MESATAKTINAIECVLVRAGTFMMGSPESESGRERGELQHQVTITKDYYVSKYPVTLAQYRAVTGKNPCRIGDDYPVKNISWNHAAAFCNAVGGRLLTEAEWEFAARGGNESKGYIYSGSNNIDEVGWYGGNIWYGDNILDILRQPVGQPVGTKAPNELGIYDMSGNVWEWCSDWYGSYSAASQTDPAGPSSGKVRVARGGCWSDESQDDCRVANRSCYAAPSIRDSIFGLRVAFNVESSETLFVEARRVERRFPLSFGAKLFAVLKRENGKS